MQTFSFSGRSWIINAERILSVSACAPQLESHPIRFQGGHSLQIYGQFLDASIAGRHVFQRRLACSQTARGFLMLFACSFGGFPKNVVVSRAFHANTSQPLYSIQWALLATAESIDEKRVASYIFVLYPGKD